MYLVKFKIKNESFNNESVYGKFGLTGPSFLMDIDKTFSHSKNIQTTSQPVIDGTTRTFHISKEPGSISISGIIGDLRYGNDKEDSYIKPITTNLLKPIRENTISGKNRLQLQRELIEYLRDNAIFLDIYVQNETTIHRNYIIKNVSENASDFGKLDISLTLEEVLLFDFPAETSIGSLYVEDEDPLTTESIKNNISIPLTGTAETNVRTAITIMLNNLKNLEGAVYIVGNSPSTAYLPLDFTNVVNIRSSRTLSSVVTDATNPVIIRQTDSSKFPYKINNQKIVFSTNSKVTRSNNINEGKFLLEIKTAPDLEGLQKTIRRFEFVDSPISSQDTTVLIEHKGRRQEFSGLPNKNFQGPEFNFDGSYFVGSNIKSNPEKEPLEKGWCFLRKKKDSTAWHAIPNLLGNVNTKTLGYLYNASFVTYGNRLYIHENLLEGYQLYPTFIWIEPRVWEYIKQELVKVRNNVPGFELNISSLP